jgi:hypothetical protein
MAEFDRTFERDIQAANADDAALGADGPVESGIDASDDDVPVPSPVRHRNTKARMDACLHEAGHAVAHWYIGIPFEQVSVGIRSLPGSGGMLSAGSVSGFTFVPQREEWLALAAAGDAPRRWTAAAWPRRWRCSAPMLGPSPRHAMSNPTCSGHRAECRSGDAHASIPTPPSLDGGGDCDWALIETDIADWPEGVAMAITARRLARAFVRGPAA